MFFEQPFYRGVTQYPIGTATISKMSKQTRCMIPVSVREIANGWRVQGTYLRRNNGQTVSPIHVRGNRG
jgi:hypothetical protein